ncbi:MAG TPA: alkaline phosphatase family protein [Thermoanaerobaculia bacterium]|nr:alkaline phosphatase family protein [Thermoanaerobaculia bacterium]
MRLLPLSRRLILATLFVTIFPSTATAATPATTADGGPGVLLVGLDGADMRIVDRLTSEGKLPTFARLKREGAFGPLRSVEPLLSPLVWTSIATGRRPQDHGVFDFVEITPQGEPTPITSTRRRVPALWNLASAYGRSSGFIGWYASYPAEEVRGFVVSDRLAFHQVSSGRATQGATYPESLAAEIRKNFGDPTPDVAATKRRFLADPAAPLTPDGAKRVEELAKIYATSELYRKLVPVLAKRDRPDVLGVYFEAIDACGHLFMEDAPPRRPDVSQQDYDAFSSTVDRCYAYQDEVLGEVLSAAGPSTVTIVVSDHGFKVAGERPRTSGRADVGMAPLWHRLYGVVFVAGKGVKPGPISGAGVLDVAPTVLALLDVPLSKELPGHPLTQAFAAGVLGKIRTVDKYAELPKRAPPPSVPADAEAVRKLMALGYLSGGGGKGIPHDADGRTAASYLNEGSARAASGDSDGALKAFGKAVQIDPENASALVYAAHIYVERGELARAGELLDRAVRLKPEDTSVRLQRAAWRLAGGDLSNANAELEAASRLDDRLPLYHILRARVADASRNFDAALSELAEAEALTDADGFLSQIYVERAEITAELGRVPEAEAAVSRASALVPEAELAGVRGRVALAKRDPASAARLFHSAIDARPKDPSLEVDLGRALGAQGDAAGADAAFGRAIAKAGTAEEKERTFGDVATYYQRTGDEARVMEILRDGTAALPASAAMWAMIGAAYGRASRMEDAIGAYEKSVAVRPTPLTCNTLAFLYYEVRHDRARATALWKQSLALQPGQRDVEALLRRAEGR